MKENNYIAKKYLKIKYNNYKNFLKYYYIEKDIFYSKMLKVMSNYLNLYNDKKFTQSQWNLLIGPWLHSITSIYLNYEYNIKKLKINPDIIKIENIKPFKDDSDYREKICDLKVNLFIIKFFKTKKLINFDFSFISNKKKKFKKDKKVFRIIIKVYIWLLSLLKIKNFHINAKFNIRDSVLLFLKSRMKIALLPSFVHRLEIHDNISYDFIKRSTTFKELSLHKNIKKKAYLIISLMPKIYLEGYKFLEENNFLKNYKHAEKFITTTSYIDDEIFKNILVNLKNKNNKIKIHLMQHGGHFNLFDYKIHSYHENIISNKFFSWGSKQNGYIPMPSTRINRYIKDKKKYFLKKNIKSICYVCPPLKLYDFQSDFFHNSNSKKILFKRKKFIESINSKINLICRPYYQKRYTHQIKVDKNISKKKFKISKNNQYLFNSNLIVFEYFSSMIFEIINLNIPFIIISDHKDYKFSSFGLKLINKMKRENILFSDPVKASNFINENFDDINNWWYEKNNFINQIKKKTALISDDYLNEWNRNILNY